MVFTCGRDVNDLALHRFHKGRIFSLWVYNNHISVRVCENDIRHFLFRRKGLAFFPLLFKVIRDDRRKVIVLVLLTEQTAKRICPVSSVLCLFIV